MTFVGQIQEKILQGELLPITNGVMCPPEWPCYSVTGVINAVRSLSGVITILISGSGPFCSNM